MPSTDVEGAPQKSTPKTFKTAGYAAHSATTPLKQFSLERREPGPKDVEIDILYCGVCHSDLHMARNEWATTVYPVVPGHEIVGRVNKVLESPPTRRCATGRLAKDRKSESLAWAGSAIWA